MSNIPQNIDVSSCNEENIEDKLNQAFDGKKVRVDFYKKEENQNRIMNLSRKPDIISESWDLFVFENTHVSFDFLYLFHPKYWYFSMAAAVDCSVTMVNFQMYKPKW